MKGFRQVVWILATSVVFVVLLAAVSALAAELTPREQAACQAQGGCEVVSNAWLRALVRSAFDLGFKTGTETASKEPTPCRRMPTT